MTHEVFTVGEAMLRLSPAPGVPLVVADEFDVHVAGSESNVAVALASLGRSVEWFSRLPRNRLGERVIRELRAAGVDVDGTVWDDHRRLGTYFVELDAGPGGVSVIYDRADSAAAALSPDDIPWESVERARVVHLSGITAALSASCLETVVTIADAAKRSDALLSVDVNHRAKLWSADEAGTAMTQLATGADLLICTREDAADVFGIDGDAPEVAIRLGEHLGVGQVAVTDGASGAVLNLGGTITTVAARPTTIRDRVGAGDAFVAGLLDGLLDGDLVAGLERGVTLAAVALATCGDQVTMGRSELERITDDSSRRVDR